MLYVTDARHNYVHDYTSHKKVLFRTCWIYKNQIIGIDLKYGSIKIFADQCGSIPINSDQ